MKKISLLLILLILSLFSLNAKANNNYVNMHVVDYDNPSSFDEIKSRYTSFDYIDGDISDKLIITSAYEDDYNNNSLKIQDYKIYVSIINSNGYKKNQIDIISVRDFKAPIIEAKNTELTVDISNEDLEDAIINNLNITDNYDTVFSNINILGLENIIIGEQNEIICNVYDNSNNKSDDIIIKLTVIKTKDKELVLNDIHTETIISDKELLALFLKDNKIDLTYNSIEVKTTYLDTPEKNGIYQVKFIFKYEDGYTKEYECKIINNIIEEEKKEKNNMNIIIISILLFLSLIGIYIFNKRKK